MSILLLISPDRRQATIEGWRDQIDYLRRHAVRYRGKVRLGMVGSM